MTRLSEPTRPTPSAAAPCCAHCGLDVPAGLIDLSRDEQFCCRGCRAAFDLIHALRMDSYYRLRDQLGEHGQPVAPGKDPAYESFDDPTFTDLYCRPAPDGAMETDLTLDGIHCAACVWLLEKLPRMRDGVLDARVDLRRKRLTLTWDAARTQLSAVAAFLDTLGYAPHPSRRGADEEQRLREDRTFLIRVAAAAVCAGNVMLIAFALYGGMFSGMAAAHAALFRWTSLALGTVALLWPGAVFLRGALAALRARTVSLDLPIALGLVAGWASGAINTVTAQGEIYFDTVTMLIFLLLVGRWIQHRQHRRAADALDLLFGLTPTTARLVTETGTRSVPLEAVHAGETVEVRPGETVPVDGVITTGVTELDRSFMTGEPRPEPATEGDTAEAGVVNITGTIRLRVTASGDETRIAQLMRLVEQSSTRNVGVVRRTDRVARWFVAVVIVAAGLTYLGWSLAGARAALDHAMTLLIVTCPCALALATPLAIVAAVGRAAREGILIRNGDALERLSKPGTIYLDKTGTLTEGRPKLTAWTGDPEALDLAASAEAHSPHPVARALLARATALTEPEHAEHIVGGGVRAIVGGRTVLAGSLAFLEANAAHIDTRRRAEAARFNDDAATAVLVAIDGECRGVAGLEDAIRLDARAAIDRLRALGWRIGILSGDAPRVVARVASRLGIDPALARGGMTPEDKLGAIDAAEGGTVMVGDGINDAAALAAAHVGVAVQGGAEASLAAAHVYTSRPGLAPLVELIEGAKRTSAVISRNLAVSLGYNTVCATLAVAGVINPIIAAVLMPASSITVLVLSYRSRTFGGAR
ncbi:MAG: heavy metal translocating P-type ATPase [Phycisphaerales bacterium]